MEISVAGFVMYMFIAFFIGGLCGQALLIIVMAARMYEEDIRKQQLLKGEEDDLSKRWDD